MNASDIRDYRQYISGSYENLSTEERMYYVDLIKQGDDCDSLDYSPHLHKNSASLPEGCDIMRELHTFFSDACEHIQWKLSNLFGEGYEKGLRYETGDVCPDFSEEFCTYITCVSYLKSSDLMSVSVNDDQCSDEYMFNYRLIDESYLDKLIEDTRESGNVPQKYKTYNKYH